MLSRFVIASHKATTLLGLVVGSVSRYFRDDQYGSCGRIILEQATLSLISSGGSSIGGLVCSWNYHYGPKKRRNSRGTIENERRKKRFKG